MSKELTAFKNHFEANCGVKVIGVIEDSSTPHWKRLRFSSLNCDDMERVSNYIKKTFSVKGYYHHLSPKVHSHEGHICLTVDVKDIINKIL